MYMWGSVFYVKLLDKLEGIPLTGENAVIEGIPLTGDDAMVLVFCLIAGLHAVSRGMGLHPSSVLE